MRHSAALLALVLTAGCASSRAIQVGSPATVTSGAATANLDAVAFDHTIGLARDPQLAALLDDVSPARLHTTDSTLVSFGTRNTLSDTLSPTRGVGATRRWIHAQLDAVSRDCGGCLRVEYDPAMVSVPRLPGREVNVVNVLAWLPGRDTSRVVVIGGHYDSCVCSRPGGTFDTVSTAPGADDDGSGSSAIMELARVFAKHYPHGLDATVVFALYAGEEQGLLGSTHLAQRLRAEGYRVVAGMTNDIVGNVTDADGQTDSTSMRVYAADPDNSPSRELGRYVWALDAVYLPSFEVRPTWRLDRIQRGGDHRPFVMQGDAGLRFTERLENYERQHLPTDDLAHVNFAYVANVARIDAATVGSLGLAPATPDSAVATRERSESGGQKWRLTWKPVPGAVGYEVLVRRTTSPSWQEIIPVGNVSQYVLASQLDDEWAAVRAVGAGGHRSLGASMPSPEGPRTLAPARAGSRAQIPGAPPTRDR